MIALLAVAALIAPPMPAPPAPTDHDAKCIVHGIRGTSHPVELKLTFVGKSQTGNPKHRWTISGDPKLFPSGSSEEMTAEEGPRYTSSEIGVSPISFRRGAAGHDSMMASNEPLPRSKAQAFGEKAFQLKYRLDFDMEPEVYAVRRKDKGFLRVYVVDEDMSLEPRSIGFCNITSQPARSR